jgi:uncharacterized protein (DUF433 family)
VNVKDSGLSHRRIDFSGVTLVSSLRQVYDSEGVQNMANVDTDVAIDWMACELIESVPGKVSGRPVVRGTRILPDAIVGSYDLGETIEELREGFPSLSVPQIERLIEFAHAQRERAKR